MTRILLHVVLPITLPFLIYIVWRVAARGRPGLANIFREGPWFWLIGAGLVLTIAGLLALPFLPVV